MNFKQEFSKLNWKQNYQYQGEELWDDTSDRVSYALAQPEEKVDFHASRFNDLISNQRWLPGGRILANAGTSYNKATLINCYVSGAKKPDVDSIEEINAEVGRCMKILASEGGYGINANWMRPRGAIIRGTGARTPGAVEMLNIWDQTAETLTKGPETETERDDAKDKIRKGAMMVTMSLWHPDVLEFIQAKSEGQRLAHFNMSVLASNRFMRAVKEDKEWDLVYPDFEQAPDLYEEEWDGNIQSWEGPVRVYETIDARDLWNTVMESTYNNNEPGVQFIDRINYRNPLYYTEYIMGSNPCGEQMLPPGGACDLGNFVLPNYLRETTPGSWKFDFDQFERDIKVAVRMLDNVNDLAYFPLDNQYEEAQNKRRIGLGHMGFGSMLLMLRIPYGSHESLLMARRIQKTLANEAAKASARLAVEKEPFPLYNEDKYLNGDMVQRLDDEAVNLIRQYGIRNSHLTSTQPTGNTSTVANNVSGGIEPVFSFTQQRTAEMPFLPEELERPSYMPSEEDEQYYREYKEDYIEIPWVAEKQNREIVWRCTKDGYEDWQIHPTRGIVRDFTLEDFGVMKMKERDVWNADAPWAVKTSDLEVADHVKVMERFAEYIDSAMSKTVNVPNDYPYDEFKQLYRDAWETGVIKGLTTYRTGTMSAVLEDHDEDSENSETKCPQCGSETREEEGCTTCPECGWQKCAI